MKLTIINVEPKCVVDGCHMIDCDPRSIHFILRNAGKPEDGGLLTATEHQCCRLIVPMHEPDPAFFFSVADRCEGARPEFELMSELVLLYDEKSNRVGGYFRK